MRKFFILYTTIILTSINTHAQSSNLFIEVSSKSNTGTITGDNIDKPRSRKQELQSLKDYAFCRCIHKYLDTNGVQLGYDVDASTSLLVELYGFNNIKGYSFIDSNVQQYVSSLPGPIGTINNAKGSLLHCIDLYNSKELRRLVRKANKMKGDKKTNWLKY